MPLQNQNKILHNGALEMQGEKKYIVCDSG